MGSVSYDDNLNIMLNGSYSDVAAYLYAQIKADPSRNAEDLLPVFAAISSGGRVPKEFVSAVDSVRVDVRSLYLKGDSTEGNSVERAFARFGCRQLLSHMLEHPAMQDLRGIMAAAGAGAQDRSEVIKRLVEFAGECGPGIERVLLNLQTPWHMVLIAMRLGWYHPKSRKWQPASPGLMYVLIQADQARHRTEHMPRLFPVDLLCGSVRDVSRALWEALDALERTVRCFLRTHPEPVVEDSSRTDAVKPTLAEWVGNTALRDAFPEWRHVDLMEACEQRAARLKWDVIRLHTERLRAFPLMRAADRRGWQLSESVGLKVLGLKVCNWVACGLLWQNRSPESCGSGERISYGQLRRQWPFEFEGCCYHKDYPRTEAGILARLAKDASDGGLGKGLEDWLEVRYTKRSTPFGMKGGENGRLGR